MGAGDIPQKPAARPRAYRAAAVQALAVLLVAAALAWLGHNTGVNLAKRGIAVGFDFLGRSARFPISESVLGYRPSDTFAWAFVVGLGNTLSLSAAVGVAATALGFGVGLARRAPNPLVRASASVFVDVLRNTPLVVQLLFWYALLTIGLPGVRAALSPIHGVFLSDRGLFLPAVRIGGSGSAALLAISLVAAAVVAALRLVLGRDAPERTRLRLGVAAAGLLLAGGVVWRWGGASLAFDWPRLGRFNFSGGVGLSPELAAIFTGLTLYTAAFIAEIVRGGIEAVAKGQWEAALALGFSRSGALRLVILPQALRIIIPPMTSQYINLVKNTTLGLVVGYPEISFVTATTINQTGQAVEGVLILMLTFLTISLVGALVMNVLNRRVALVQR